MIRAIGAYVMKSERLGDCTLNGVTSRFDQFTVIEDTNQSFKSKQDLTEIDDFLISFGRKDDIDFDRVLIVNRLRRNPDDKEYVRLYPYNPYKVNNWCMAGGNFVYSSDSRFHEINPYPISVHDRIEEYK